MKVKNSHVEIFPLVVLKELECRNNIYSWSLQLTVMPTSTKYKADIFTAVAQTYQYCWWQYSSDCECDCWQEIAFLHRFQTSERLNGQYPALLLILYPFEFSLCMPLQCLRGWPCFYGLKVLWSFRTNKGKMKWSRDYYFGFIQLLSDNVASGWRCSELFSLVHIDTIDLFAGNDKF